PFPGTVKFSAIIAGAAANVPLSACCPQVTLRSTTSFPGVLPKRGFRVVTHSRHRRIGAFHNTGIRHDPDVASVTPLPVPSVIDSGTTLNPLPTWVSLSFEIVGAVYVSTLTCSSF